MKKKKQKYDYDGIITSAIFCFLGATALSFGRDTQELIVGSTLFLVGIQMIVGIGILNKINKCKK